MSPRRDLSLEGAQRACTVSGFDNEKVSGYSVSVAQRASIEIGP